MKNRHRSAFKFFRINTQKYTEKAAEYKKFRPSQVFFHHQLTMANQMHFPVFDI